MKARHIFFTVLLILVAIVLFHNQEEIPFWLFGELHTSIPMVVVISFVCGVVTGALLFRRRKKLSKVNYSTDPEEPDTDADRSASGDTLSDEDRAYLSRD